MGWISRPLSNGMELLWRGDMSGIHVAKRKGIGFETIVEIPTEIIELMVTQYIKGKAMSVFESRLEKLEFKDLANGLTANALKSHSS